MVGQLIGLLGGTVLPMLNAVFNTMHSGFNMAVSFQNKGIDLSRRLGMSIQDANAYTKVLTTRTQELAAKYGVTSKMIHEVQEGIVAATNRQIILNKSQQEGLLQLQKLAGGDAVAKFTDEIMNGMGGQVQTVENAVAKAYATAAKSGLNAQAVTKKIGDNLSMANKLSFRNGLDSLTRMAMQAEKVGLNLQSVESVAKSFMDIGDAIENSAKLQMLGGSAGVFGSNPLAMAYEANYDPEAMQDRMVKMFGGLAQFDAKTGMSRVGGMNMDIIRNMAKAMGMDESEAVKVAKKNAELKYKENQFGGARGNLTQEQWDFVMNKSFVENGRLYMTDKDGNKQDISGGITNTGLIDEMMKYANMSDHDILAENSQKLSTIDEHIMGWQDKIVAQFAQAFAPYMPKLQTAVNKIGSVLSGLAGPLANGVVKGVEGIVNFIYEHKEGIKKFVNAGIGFFQWMFGMAEKYPRAFVGVLIASRLFGPVGMLTGGFSVIKGIAKGVGGILKWLGSGASKLFSGIGNLFRGGRMGGSLGIGNKLKAVANGLGRALQKAGSKFVEWVGKAGSKFLEMTKKALPHIKRGLGQAARGIGKGAQWVGRNAAKLWKAIPKTVKVGSAVSIAGAVGNGLVDAGLESGKLERGGFGHTAGRTASTAAEWAGIGAMLGSVIPGVGNVAGGIIGGVAGAAKGYYDSYKDWQQDPKNANAGFGDYFKMQMGQIGDWFKKKISDNAGLILDIFMPWRVVIRNWDGLVDWFKKKWAPAILGFIKVRQKIETFFKEYNPLALARKGGQWIGEKMGFSEGGIVGGTSYSGDKKLIKVNSGEMVLNRESQSSLFKFIKGSSSAIVGTTPLGAVAERVYSRNSERTMNVDGRNVTVRDFNVNVSGTIKLDAGSNSASVDVRELLGNTAFVSSLKDIIKESINNDINGGRFMSDIPSRRGMPSQTGIWGKKK